MKEQKNRLTNERDYHQVPDYRPADPEKAKLILKLGTMITDRYLQKYTHTLKMDDPEYWALDAVLTKEEVKFLLSFKKTRVPYDAPTLARMNNMSLEDTEKMIKHLCWVGVLEMNRENEDRHRQYNVPIFVPGSAEFMMMNDQLTEAHPELATFFNLMTQMPLEGITQMIPLGGSGVGMHVIPVEKAIEHENKSVSVEHISHWLNKYDKYSVGQCTCRKQQSMRGEGSGEINGEFCMGVGDMAEYCVEKGMGRYITYEEALEILERAERHGFIHQITNIDGEDKIVAICNCTPGVCNAIRTSQLYNTPNMSQLSQRRQDQLLRHRHRPLQDRVSGPSRHPGLYPAGQGGPVSGRPEAHQAGQPPARRLRRHLQPALRGRLHPGDRRRAAGYRRDQKVHRRPGAEGGGSLRPRLREGRRRHVGPGLQDGHHRRRSRGPLLRLLPAHPGLRRDRLREGERPRRHAPPRHPLLPAGKGRAERGDRRAQNHERCVPLRRGGGP